MSGAGVVEVPPRKIIGGMRSVTRGWRSLSSLGALSNGMWTDRAAGRLLSRLAQICGLSAPALLPGPIWSACRLGVPMLSWFELPGAGGLDMQIAKWVQAAMADTSGPTPGSAPELNGLMARVAATNADSARDVIPECPPELLAEKRECVLLVYRHARTNSEAASIARMVKAAIQNHPDAAFWIWPMADGKSGCLSRMRAQLPDVRQIRRGFSLFATLAQVKHFYTVDAPEGMQALLAGVPVYVFGSPYYAGWGLTRDDLPIPGRTARPTLAALFEVVYLRLTRYLDPETHSPGTLPQVLDSIELQRSIRTRYADCADVTGVRFQLWKRCFAIPFLTAGGGALRWASMLLQVSPGERVALWGGKSAEGIPADALVLRIEDGFFHSDGLGSDMNAPCSQVLDRLGLYFDARQPSELTHILNEADFDAVELARAAALRKLVCRHGVTKYNLGRRAPSWQAPEDKRVILVAGQVADDASIRFGTGTIATSEALLEIVRQRNPEAFLVYKPHPDVLSGNRSGLIHAQRLADVVDAEADVLSLIDRADEVHVLSSLAGFDALQRGKHVFTYGLPFYAGWGLTEDELQQPWRQRKLTLNMLVAGTLLRYPLYWDWRMRMFTTPESVVRLLGRTASRPLVRIAGDPARWPRKIWRWTRNAVQFVLWAFRSSRASRRRELSQ